MPKTKNSMPDDPLDDGVLSERRQPRLPGWHRFRDRMPTLGQWIWLHDPQDPEGPVRIQTPGGIDVFQGARSWWAPVEPPEIPT